jgi:DeoR/GlpR family transcriptional regulator of sugar metabolism
VRYTQAPTRRAELLRRLAADGYVSSAQLAADLGVSEMTIRRDVRQLAAEGLVRRVIGGATAPGGVPFETRSLVEGSLKQAIADACLPLLASAGTIALDAGTTVAPLAERVAPGCIIVSHSVPVILACTQRDDIDLIGVGGNYQQTTRAFAGPPTRHAFESLAVDVAVLSATAVDFGGIFSANALDAETKRVMASVADTTILLVDSTKLGTRAPIRVDALSLADVVVTDALAPPGMLDLFRDAGVSVVVATPAPAGAVS